MIKTNKELANLIRQTIKSSGYKKTWIADQLGVTRQGFDKMLDKQTFSLDDANKILSIIGCELSTNISVIKKICKNE